MIYILVQKSFVLLFYYDQECTRYGQLILDFLDEVVQRPTVLLGNSVGSLACVIAAAGVFQFSLCIWMKKYCSLPKILDINYLEPIVKSFELIFSPDRIESVPSTRACAVQLRWWHEQQGYCWWLENKATLAFALAFWLLTEAKRNCFLFIWSCQTKVLSLVVLLSSAEVAD